MQTAKRELKSTILSVNLPAEILDKLNKVSKFEERPKSYYIKKGLSEILNQRCQDIEDHLSAKKTMEQVLAKNEKLVSFDEVFKTAKG